MDSHGPSNLIGGGEGGSREAALDVCSCPMIDGVWVCKLQRGGSRLKSTGCSGSVRTTGQGFVTAMESGFWEEFEVVILEKATMTCDMELQTTLIIDGIVCDPPTTTASQSTTTANNSKVMTNEPKPRPPAIPVDRDDEDDDDDDDEGHQYYYDDDDNDDDDDDATTTSLPTTTTTGRIVTIAATISYRNVLIVIGVGVLVASTATVIIVRVRICRRRSAIPEQVNEVSSTTDQPQRTYVLREVPRSPRRRGTSDYESVTLFAVDDHEL